MNFIPNYQIPPVMPNNMNIIDIDQIINKLNEYDNRIRALEEKLSKLENKTNEPDNNFYMI